MRRGQHIVLSNLFFFQTEQYKYRYDPVGASDTDDFVIDKRQEATPKKRDLEHKELCLIPETNVTPLTTPMAEPYELEPIGQDDPEQEYFYIHVSTK